jgi:hypothetical protein
VAPISKQQREVKSAAAAESDEQQDELQEEAGMVKRKG